MEAACSSTLCAWRTISSPSGVTETSLALRSNSFTSSSSSSFLMATDSVGCDTKQASAARPKCFSRATATMYLSSVSVTSGLQVVGFSTQPAGDVLVGQFRVAVEQQGRHAARPFEQLCVGHQIRKTQQGCTRLPRTQEFAR